MSENEFNQEFLTTVEQINAKLKVAADAMREVNELREKANLPSIIPSMWVFENIECDHTNEEDYDPDQVRDELEAKLELIDVSELEAQMDRAGWQSSASYC